jgi:hypothetical protein
MNTEKFRVRCYQCNNWVLEEHIHKEQFKMGNTPLEVNLCSSCWLIMKRVDESLEAKKLEVEVLRATEDNRTRNSQEFGT